MEYILTLDVGTTSVKCALFDDELRQVHVGIAEYSLITPKTHIIEVEPDTYLEKIHDCIKAMAQRGAPIYQVRYIVATTQGETLIPVDSAGTPLSNAIVWLDSRAEAEGAQLAQIYSKDAFYHTTGLPGIDGYTPVSKLKKLSHDFSANGQKLGKYLLLEDYLIWKLTGHMVTEKSLLSSTGYFNIRRDCLWKEILTDASVKVEQIPDVLECGETVGKILPEMANYLGVDSEAVIVTGAMDQVCGAVGCGNISDGMLHETTGTAMVLGASTTTPNFDTHLDITIYRHALSGLYLLMPVCRTAAIVQKWFVEQFCKEEAEIAAQRDISVYDLLSEFAQQVKTEETPLLLPYFNGSLTPCSIESARGAFWNIGLDTTKYHFARAIPEGIAFMLRENTEMLCRMGMSFRSLFSLGGPSKNPFWCQMKADIIGKDIIAAPGMESTSFGAACLAAVVSGYATDLEQASKMYRDYITFRPNTAMAEKYNTKYEQYKKLVKCAAEFYI